MNLDEFFGLVLPSGINVIATIVDGKFQNTVCESADARSSAVVRLKLRELDCYFALAALKQKYATKPNGKKGTRFNGNIRALKSFFADIDIDPDNPDKYASREIALASLEQFYTTFDFPAPMVVSSGAGLHVYWPLTKEIPVDKWRVAAEAFKSGLINSGLLIDPTRTADACSVLRVPGTHNVKRDATVQILSECGALDARTLIERMKTLPIHMVNRRVRRIEKADTPFNDLDSNTSQTFEPSKLHLILESCTQLEMVQVDGGKSEPLWYAALGIARHTTSPDEDAVTLSENYRGFSKAETLAKLHQVTKDEIGPTTCAKFDELNPGVCGFCVKFGKIKSPITLGVARRTESIVVLDPDDPNKPVSVTLPKAPYPYTLASAGISVSIEGKAETICPWPFFPVQRFHDEKLDAGVTVWRVMLPFERSRDLHIEQGLLADPKALHKYLLSQHIPVMPGKIRLMVSYMISYIKQLQDESRTEKLLSRLGWRDDNKAFVLGSKVYTSTGAVVTHRMSDSLIKDMPGLRQAGTFEGWRDMIQFYNEDGHEAHRFMLYASMASPLFHMTGHKGALIFASGKSGTGKTTVLRAINSVWGHPTELEVNATRNGMTENAIFGLMGVYNNLPMSMDDMTNLDPGVFASIALGISQGAGKRRSTRTGELARMMDSWAFLAFASSNVDAYAMLIRNKGAAAAEAMRIFQLHMTLPTRYTKQEADKFANEDMFVDYGHAGHVYIPWVVSNYDSIKNFLLKNVEKVGDKVKIASAERFWSGIVGSAATAGAIARKIGLFPDFPVEKDIAWATNQILSTRRQVSDHVATPAEVLSEYLEARLAQTLVVSSASRGSAQIRVEQEPRSSLEVRLEKDTGHAWIMKSAFRDYCTEVGADFTEIQDTLFNHGSLLEKNARRILGQGTDFGKGQVRAWVVDMRKLAVYGNV